MHARAESDDEFAVLRTEVIRLHLQGNHSDAIPLAERWVAQARQKLGENDQEYPIAIFYLATSLNNLADLYRTQGRYAEAEPLSKRALAIREKALGPDHPDVAVSLNNLAELYRAQGRDEETEPLYKRSLAIWEKALGSDNPDLAAGLNNLAELYRGQRRFADAEPLYKRSVALLEKSPGRELAIVLNNLAALYRDQGGFADAEPLYIRSIAVQERVMGPDHPDVGNSLDDLGSFYLTQGRYSEAEPLYRRSLAIRERLLGSDHPDVSTSLKNLARLYQYQGYPADAEPLYKRVLAIREKALGPDHPDVAQSLNNLAEMYRAQSRLAEAEPLQKRAVSIFEKALGPQDPILGASLGNLASLYHDQGRFADAEPLYLRSLAILETARGAEHTDVGTCLNNLAELYRDQGRFADAEPLYKRSLAIREKAHGTEHHDVGASLNNLARLYEEQGRFADAEPLYKRGLAIMEKALGTEHPSVGTALNNLAALYRSQGRFADAELLYSRSLGIREQALGPDHPEVARSLNSLALLFQDQGRFADAAPLYERVVATFEKALGPEHPDVASALNNLAALMQHQRRFAEAEPLYKRSLAIREKALGPDHPDVATALNNLAFLALEQQDWVRAADYWRRAAKVIERRAERGLARSDGGSKNGPAEAVQMNWFFSGIVKATDRLAPQGHTDRARQGREMFEKAQWVRASEAASSLLQMAARSAKGDTALAGLVRERQDLVTEWQAHDKQLIAAKIQSTTRDLDAEKSLSDRLGEIESRLASIDQRLGKEFANYALLTSPVPASVADVQAQLHDNEALVLLLDTPEIEPTMAEETFIWAITKDEMRWVKSALSTKELTEHVAALHCGLDHTLWDDAESAHHCKDLVSASPYVETLMIGGKEEGTDVLPFDLARAHELYKALLEPVADITSDKRLIVVPSGSLTSLPFYVLVTEPPKVTIPKALAQYRDVAWLGARTAISILPSASSLKALRQFAKSSHARKPYLGIGNPLLEGRQDDPAWGAEDKKRAELARGKSCTEAPSLRQMASLRGPRPMGGFAPMFHGTQVDIEEIRYQSPLPETADELCQVARRLGVPDSEIFLGADATEARLKDLSESGRLADYAILHFATHGALSGQITGSAEPGLILTPPPKGTRDPQALERDDGFLTASEIATFKLDADWVILSACNTAGAQGEGADALSGMARAFFYAGARALLVSHWEVESDAAVKLTTGAITELKAHPEIGRAEAFRISMKELIEKGSLAEAHPRYWAPFVIVGEGSADANALTISSIVPPPPAQLHPAEPVIKPKPQSVKKAVPPDWRTEIWRR